MNERGRRIGETHPRAKLTNHEVDLVRDLAEELLAGAKEELHTAPGKKCEITGRENCKAKTCGVYRTIAEKFERAPRTVKAIVRCERRAQIASRIKRVPA